MKIATIQRCLSDCSFSEHRRKFHQIIRPGTAVKQHRLHERQCIKVKASPVDDVVRPTELSGEQQGAVQNTIRLIRNFVATREELVPFDSNAYNAALLVWYD